MGTTRFDWRTFLLIFGVALVGAAWAIYNRGLANPPYSEAEFRPLVWVIFATPLALCIGWWIARPGERWWAAFVSFCVYFFSPFVAARYESCTVVTGRFDVLACFTRTAEAQTLANNNGHLIYFQAILVVQVIAALVVALHRALARSTIRQHTSLPLPTDR